jgi:ribonucleoside-diphosphate reductase alpha chain
MIFKYGSGSGLNVSSIRSSRERLAGGGTASGPVSFMKAADASAGVIKSGGKTRRAAKMVVLNADHPDIKPFILCKWKEEEKAHKLISLGYDASIDGEAYSSIFFQNANNSVRATDDFMRRAVAGENWELRAVTTGEVIEQLSARDLLRMIAEATWHCGDPGMQFDTTVNDWHTCPNSGRINASNPCSEYMHLDNSACLGPEVRVSTKQGLLPVAELYRRQEAGETIYLKTELLSEHAAVPRRGKRGYRPADVYARQLAFRPAVVIKTGRKLLYRIELSTGQAIRLTADHKVLTEEGWKQVQDLTAGKDAIVTQKQSTPIDYSEASQDQLEQYHMLGWMTGDGYYSDNSQRAAFGLVFGPQDQRTAEYLQPIFNRFVHEHTLAPTRTVGISTQSNGVMQIGSTAQVAFQKLAETYGMHPATAPDKCLPSCVFEAPKVLQAAFLGALFSADGTIFTRNADEMDKPLLLVRLTSTSPQLLNDTQVLLFDFGIRCSITWTHPEGRKNPQGTLSIHGYQAYKFCQIVGFPLSDGKRAIATRVLSNPYDGNAFAGRRALVDRISEDGMDDVYDISEPVTHSMIAEGMIIHNCNLASINLLKFVDDEGNFLVEPFRYAVQVMTIAQDILVDNSSYPTQKIGENARAFRELGLGYANLGALLMSQGMAYDSDEGRAYAGAITALLCGQAYETSARIAEQLGPYRGFAINREPQLRVLRKHRAQVDKINHRLVPPPLLQASARAWDESIRLGEEFGVRNSQMTVLAPTGTIAFLMDCDTTGVEPDIALIKYKRLVGGGMLKIVNQTVPRALKRLGYGVEQVEAILKHLDEKETIEGAPGLKPEHVGVFDCAFKPRNGRRTISYTGHLRMMASAQPFISGAISKTVNLPQEATVEDIMEAYTEAWRLGLKAIAIYRDGSKAVQPLSTSGKSDKSDKSGEKAKAPGQPYRRRMADERQALIHKFSIGGHEGYLTIGLFEDNTPGEIFICMSKEGSTLSGVMDSFATTVSLALQYGVPLRVLVDKFSHVRFEPSGVTNNKDIRFAKSVVDYIFRYLALKFLPKDQAKQLTEEPKLNGDLVAVKPKLEANGSRPNPLEQHEHNTFVAQADAPACHECGSLMVRNGNCYKCGNCGSTSGCS